MTKGQIEIFNLVKKKLFERNEIDKAEDLLSSYTDYYYQLIGKCDSDQMEKKLLRFVKGKAKKLGVSLD